MAQSVSFHSKNLWIFLESENSKNMTLANRAKVLKYRTTVRNVHKTTASNPTLVELK